jgi:ADP-dependent NAD(P)H-hydrate dehydratase / NAD(P)H-hydrate epimerase
MNAVAVGPGIPKGPAMAALVRRLVVECALPMVVDADALNELGQDVAILVNAAAPRVLTPHPAEMARLLGLTTKEVQSDRLVAVRTLAAKSNAVVVLKGARTLVAHPDGTVYINPAANPALGTAGSGDVLTGVVGSLLAQGLSPVQAAVCGVFLHGMAGENACRELAVQSLVAGELPDAVARVQANLMRSVG